MSTIRTLNKWANSHYSRLMNILRMLFGVFLFYKGVEFESQTEYLSQLIDPAGSSEWTLFLVHYVAMAHFAGGILVFFGLITRLALLVQFPIFVGAVIINIRNGAEAAMMIQAIVGLLASVIFILYGSGRYSVDYKLKMGM